MADTEIARWEADWKRHITVDDLRNEFHGTITYSVVEPCVVEEDAWTVSAPGLARDGTCRVEVTGRGDTKEEALQAWWENWLNYYAPESVYEDRLRLALRSSGDPRFQHIRIEGYDD